VFIVPGSGFPGSGFREAVPGIALKMYGPLPSDDGTT